MILYDPLGGFVASGKITSKSRHCFLMTRLGKPISPKIQALNKKITQICKDKNYAVIDASSIVTGRDFLAKIWKTIAAVPLAVAVLHEDMSEETRANIYYELGVAQAMGKETVVVKSPGVNMPSDFVRTEYIPYDKNFTNNFKSYLKNMIDDVAPSYELMGDQLEKNPVLSLDYYRRSFLISGDEKLRRKARQLIKDNDFNLRSKNSIEATLSNF